MKQIIRNIMFIQLDIAKAFRSYLVDERQSIYLLIGECYSIIFKEELYSRVKVYNRENNKILI